ncbi:hypothetical protein LDL77_04925 [Flagellimonas marinaquae]|uniref:Arginyl-tRNA synthetase n=1 Tax=Flagellimonas aurea TaxID=2915619 RepID=A0ABS3G883_9FLAO|nr:hypothetical protein [Allomuricauda aurea]MAO16013.1 hypothetical protein [Allomuricauda sp.]MBO0355133.1 hypothetical protein [Allomuricauda aurea]UBZ15061.1 hypothetical protein LDL77_04925 [Allomuricauda aquimarina]|tara:strand:+ start:2971 stop:3396 length:426 start_codon:yes stop_codon:yes gene_type:complete
MLLNVSYNDKIITKKIDDAVGKPIPIKERFAMGGIGSPKLFVTEASIDIYNLLILDNSTNTCNVEIRPNGIIVRFRARLETYGLIIPYYKLNVYKGDIGIYSIYMDHYFIKVKSDTKAIQRFFRKLMDHRADNLPTNLEDL